jgi:hypothetical protein
MKKLRTNENGFGLIEILLIIVIFGVALFGGYLVDRAQTPKNTVSTKNTSSNSPSSKASNSNSSDSNSNNPSSSDSSSTSGEQLSTKGMTRPSQYLQICIASDNTEYITQGTPQCLGSDEYEGSYSAGVPGTLFSSPCETTSGSLRYVYISQDETCPDSTKLVFYNTLCPANASSSDDCTTPDSQDTTN